MNKEERDRLKQEVYALWYHEEDQAKKITFQKILDLLDFADEVRSRLKAVEALFQEIV
jgi:hypothetical protein